MTLEQFSKSIPEFTCLSHTEAIKHFAWYLHTYGNVDNLKTSDISRCFAQLHMDLPSNVSQMLISMESKKPKQFLKTKFGWKLEKRIRDAFDIRFGQRQATVQVTKMLGDLPARIPSFPERTFLDEALICFSHGAFRAATVMTWCLAFHHLCSYIIKNKLNEFNTRWQINFPSHHKNNVRVIVVVDDFGDHLKESEIIEIAKSASIISNDVAKILKEKLGKRNSAAHPSSVKIAQLQAEEFIDDLVNNVVLKLV